MNEHINTYLNLCRMRQVETANNDTDSKGCGTCPKLNGITYFCTFPRNHNICLKKKISVRIRRIQA